MPHDAKAEVGILIATATEHTRHEAAASSTTAAFCAERAAKLPDADQARYDGQARPDTS